MSDKCFWVYILQCENNSYYTGYTTDMVRRYQEHVLGTDKCKYTRSFKPVKIARCWHVFGDKTVALQIERFIKNLSRIEKEKLIKQPKSIEKLFACQGVSGIKTRKIVLGKVQVKS